jgi:hypothetical protein
MELGYFCRDYFFLVAKQKSCVFFRNINVALMNKIRGFRKPLKTNNLKFNDGLDKSYFFESAILEILDCG